LAPGIKEPLHATVIQRDALLGLLFFGPFAVIGLGLFLTEVARMALYDSAELNK